jgi:hypothetical protein
MVWPRSKNGTRKTAQNSIEVDAKTKESTGKTEEKLDGRNKEGHERKKPKKGRWKDRRQWSLGVGKRRKSFETGDDDDDDDDESLRTALPRSQNI